MNPKFVKALQFVFFLLTGLVLLYFAFRGIDLNDMMLQIRQADYSWVAFSMFFAIMALVFRTLRWRLLIEPLDEYPKHIHIFHAINVGYLANFVFPRIGEITRCGILYRTDHIPADRLFGTVIVERIFDVLMSALMLLLILLLRYDVVGAFIMEHFMQPVMNSMPGVGSMVWFFAILALMVLACFVFYRLFRTQLSKFSFLKKIRDLMQGIVQGIKSVYHVRNIAWFVALNFLIYGMYFMQTYVMFFALESTSALGVGDGLFVLVLSAFALILPVQGGIGAYHWFVSMGMTIFGIAREDGMVYATISHSVTAILFILLGTVSLIFVFYGKKNVR